MGWIHIKMKAVIFFIFEIVLRILTDSFEIQI